MFTNRIYSFATLFGALMFGACLDTRADETASAVTDETNASVTAEAQSITAGDNTPEPPPSSSDIRPLAVFSVPSGVRVCYPELSANQSAGIAGFFAFQNFVKFPKLIVFHRRNALSAQTKIFTGDVVPDAGGFYSKVFNTSNGNAALFPGLFQFCLRNPAVNPGPFFSDAQVVTF